MPNLDGKPVCPDAASFRDPAGYVFRDEGVFKRAVTPRGRPDYDQLMSSGLYQVLAGRSLLLAHREEPGHPDPATGIDKILVPEQVPHVSYFYEWSFAQLKDAALLTLEIQRLALRHGLSLKDASAFNVQFVGPRPVFIDTLSFEANPPGPWVAYGQFCMHFLAPLALMARVSLDFSRFLPGWLDGLPLALASSLLPRSTWLRLGLLLHLHLHARSQARYAGRRAAPAAPRAQASGPDRKPAIVDSLTRTIEGLRLPRLKTEWIDYYGEATHYSSRAETFKKEQVDRILGELRPALIYDLGGNVGAYSRLATARGIDAVCYDIDPLCVNENYLRSKASGDRHMLPLLADLTNPSPALGFNLEERLSFFERSRPGLVLALALLHHLRITGNIPFANIARFLARLAPALLIEFVPKDDPMAQAITGNRPDIFHDYSWETFRAAFDPYFVLDYCGDIPETSRRLCLFRRRG